MGESRPGDRHKPVFPEQAVPDFPIHELPASGLPPDHHDGYARAINRVPTDLVQVLGIVAVGRAIERAIGEDFVVLAERLDEAVDDRLLAPVMIADEDFWLRYDRSSLV